MVKNTFIPMRSATQPSDFFGRDDEVKTICRSLDSGHVAIQGPIGIGKTSLMERIRQIEEGLNVRANSEVTEPAQSYLAVGNKDVKTLDQAAHLMLKRFVSLDKRQESRTLSFRNILGLEKQTTATADLFQEGRRFDKLEELITEASNIAPNTRIILAFDEADKCPRPIAGLIRAIITHCDSNCIRNIRFIVSGVSPYFQDMVNEDNGISRFFTKVVSLSSMTPDEAAELVETKLDEFVENYSKSQLDIRYDPAIIETIVNLAGGHPHLLQLLGYHAIESELLDADGTINNRDIFGSLNQICYRDRSYVYESILHILDVNNKMEAFQGLLSLAHTHCPTLIDREDATDRYGPEILHWFVENNIINPITSDNYVLVDEFLRIRHLLDATDEAASKERDIINNEAGDAASLFNQTTSSYDLYVIEDEQRDLISIDEEDLPILKIESNNEPLKTNDTATFDVFAKSSTNRNSVINADNDEIVAALSHRTKGVVARVALELVEDIELDPNRWTFVSEVEIPRMKRGYYTVRVHIRTHALEGVTEWEQSEPLYIRVFA